MTARTCVEHRRHTDDRQTEDDEAGGGHLPAGHERLGECLAGFEPCGRPRRPQDALSRRLEPIDNPLTQWEFWSDNGEVGAMFEGGGHGSLSPFTWKV